MELNCELWAQIHSEEMLNSRRGNLKCSRWQYQKWSCHRISCFLAMQVIIHEEKVFQIGGDYELISPIIPGFIWCTLIILVTNVTCQFLWHGLYQMYYAMQRTSNKPSFFFLLLSTKSEVNIRARYLECIPIIIC